MRFSRKADYLKTPRDDAAVKAGQYDDIYKNFEGLHALVTRRLKDSAIIRDPEPPAEDSRCVCTLTLGLFFSHTLHMFVVKVQSLYFVLQGVLEFFLVRVGKFVKLFHVLRAFSQGAGFGECTSQNWVRCGKCVKSAYEPKNAANAGNTMTRYPENYFDVFNECHLRVTAAPTHIFL